jgi:nitronate monooxygenase
MTLPEGWWQRLTLPLIAAPMTVASSAELVAAACSHGVIGALPTHNAREDELPAWLERIDRELELARRQSSTIAPIAANVIVHPSNPRRDRDIERLLDRGVELVITSVGSPAPVLARLQEAGCLVFADVASMHHAERAIEVGADGLVLLSAGAGGQTGWLNPLAYIRAVRRRFDGPIVLAGGIADGYALAAAITAGADLAYMGTRFIATHESGAAEAYKAALVTAGPDDVKLTTALTGLPVNTLVIPEAATSGGRSPGGFEQSDLMSFKDAWSAGHSVTGVDRITDVAALIEQTRQEYLAAGRRAGAVTP